MEKQSRKDQDDAELFAKNAEAYYNLGNFEAAIKEMDKVVSLDPQNSDHYVNRALAYKGLENYDAAIKEMDKAISLEPRNSDYYYDRALAYNNSIGDYLTPDSFEKQSKKVKNRFQKSIEDCTKTIYLDPQNAGAYQMRANLYRFMGKDFQAIQDFIEVISLDPENEDASHWLTTMLNVQEQSDSMTAFIEDNISTKNLTGKERLIEVDITRTVTEVLGTLSYDKVDRVLSWNGNEGTKKAMERLAFNYFEGKGHPPLSEENVEEFLDHLHKVISGSIKVSKPKKYKN